MYSLSCILTNDSWSEAYAAADKKEITYAYIKSVWQFLLYFNIFKPPVVKMWDQQPTTQVGQKGNGGFLLEFSSMGSEADIA